LSTDELALAGGLASKLSEAETRAIKLLTPPRPVVTEDDTSNETTDTGGKTWKRVGSDNKSRLSHEESLMETKGLIEKLKQNDKLRLTIHWTLEEESE